MAELKKLQKNGTDIYPVTLEDVVFDTDGNTLPNKYQTKSDDTLNTVDKTVIGAINEVNTELAEVKQSVSNGKSLIASAITDKGIETLSDATFQTMADNIGLIEGNGSNLPSWYTPEKNIWIEGSSVEDRRCSLASCLIGSKIYTFGGMTDVSSGGDGSSTIICDYVNWYDTSNNTEGFVASMPTARYQMIAESVNNMAYVIGGYGSSSLKINECYDPSTDTWTTKTSMTATRSGLASGMVDNKIYCIGGYENMSINEEYDPSTDTWSTKASMITGRRYSTSSTINDKIYCIGGGKQGSTWMSTNEYYDPSTDTWSSKTNMPTARNRLTSSVINNKIYCMGGMTNTSIYTLANECYDIETDTWETKTNIIKFIDYACSEAVDSYIYIIGGYNPDDKYLKSTYCYISKNDN